MRLYLKGMRIDRKLSQANLAKKIGVSQPYYCEMEKGSRQQDMAYSMMEKLAEAFDVPVRVIIDAESEYATSLSASNQSTA